MLRPDRAAGRAMAEANRPAEARAFVLRAAVAALENGRYQEGERLAGAWMAQHPLDLEVTLLRGLALAAQGACTAAAPILLGVAAARPGFAHPCSDLARLLPQALSLVATQFRACRRLAPGDDRLTLAYADMLHEARRPAAAAAVLRALLRRRPTLATAHRLFGMVLLDLGDPAGSIAALRRATVLAPDDAAAWSNLGVALKIEGRFDEAARAHDHAVALAPADAQVRLNRAVALLRAGRMAEAWPDYEFRLLIGPPPPLPRATLLPTLAPAEQLGGRTVLAWHEEGFGDTLQFARYLPMLAARGARVVASVPAPLRRLLATLAGVDLVTGPPAPVPDHDWHCPLFSLPRVFATTLETIPAAVPYLHADPGERAAWASLLPAEGVRVGLVWAGQARPWLPGFAALDERRSLPLRALKPLAAVPGVRLVALQAGPAAEQARALPAGLFAAEPMPDVHDFAATAAIIANLDVVVSVDTAVAHLAGALGRTVFLLDRYDSCWRWLAGRRRSPWYPTLRIFRQTRMDDWAPVIAAVATALTALAHRRMRG